MVFRLTSKRTSVGTFQKLGPSAESIIGSSRESAQTSEDVFCFEATSGRKDAPGRAGLQITGQSRFSMLRAVPHSAMMSQRLGVRVFLVTAESKILLTHNTSTYMISIQLKEFNSSK